MTEFKPVQGYEGLYSVSSDGVVYTHSRRKVKPGPLRQGTTKRGYKLVNLLKNGKSTSFYVHRLVAKHFLDTPEKEQVNHKDCDKTNNKVDNLEWATNEENRLHALANGRPFGRRAAAQSTGPIESQSSGSLSSGELL